MIEVSEVMEALCKNGLRSTSGRSLPKERPKGAAEVSPGHRPGYTASAAYALKGQKHCCSGDSFAPSGRWLHTI